MRWLMKILDKIFRNLYKYMSWFLIFVLFVAFIAISAQYVGDTLATKILNSKHLNVSVVLGEDKNDNDSLIEIIKSTKNNDLIKNANVDFVVLTKNDEMTIKNIKNGKFGILITKDRLFIDDLAKREKLAILAKNLFNIDNLPYISFSEFDEYVSIVEKYNDTKIFLGFSSSSNGTERTKILKIVSLIGEVIAKKHSSIDED